MSFLILVDLHLLLLGLSSYLLVPGKLFPNCQMLFVGYWLFGLPPSLLSSDLLLKLPYRWGFGHLSTWTLTGHTSNAKKNSNPYTVECIVD